MTDKQRQETYAQMLVRLSRSNFRSRFHLKAQDKQYIRTGLSTSKTGTQRTFSITGDRYIGDAVQDYCFGLDIAHGVGQAVVVPYVYFSVLTGKGEKGQVSIIVNSDGGGNAGENSAISIDLRSVGTKPTAYSYSVGV